MCSTYLSIILKLIRIVYKLSITSCCDELATAFISFVSNTMTDAIRPSQGKQWHQNLSLGSKFQSRVLKIPPPNQQNERDFKIEEVFERRDDGSTPAPHRYEHAIERSLYYASAPLA